MGDLCDSRKRNRRHPDGKPPATPVRRSGPACCSFRPSRNTWSAPARSGCTPRDRPVPGARTSSLLRLARRRQSAPPTRSWPGLRVPAGRCVGAVPGWGLQPNQRSDGAGRGPGQGASGLHRCVDLWGVGRSSRVLGNADAEGGW